MISSKVFQLLAGVGLGLGALTTPAPAAVFQASTTVSLFNSGGFGSIDFSLPLYSGPGTIIGANIKFSGSAEGSDSYPYDTQFGITVPSYSSTWEFFVLFFPPLTTSPLTTSFLTVSATAEYVGGSVPPCTDCIGLIDNFFASTSPTSFSGSANLTDFSDFAGSGSNTFQIEETGFNDTLDGLATITETILTSVPEPSTWVMALIGFAIVGFAAHSRRLARPPRRLV
jgi:PEP-CTERM motif